MVYLGDQTEWNEKKLEALRYEYSLKETETVLDIGSYRGEFAREIIRKFGCKVECFEALDNRAAWTYDGRVRMGGAFLYTSVFTEGGQEFGCEDIAKYLDRKVALVKINIEGGEYELLRYIIGKGLHRNIVNLQVQFHKIEGEDWQQWYDEIVVELSKSHGLTWRYEFVWENWKLC